MQKLNDTENAYIAVGTILSQRSGLSQPSNMYGQNVQKHKVYTHSLNNESIFANSGVDS